ncbi:hypothetical protein SteCoe_23419 [Stentor coeruleus]|uniref:RanBP2-type domain-containing protein n=1 Tax=Stentor coeruleus TaxID=5963 RepID=A0A1R2BJX9_9CILI|nr:hypothetical protein SteCoe_23419 [Stentor coeruleus]
MLYESFNLEEILFEKNIGGNDCFLESVICLLFGCYEFRKSFSQHIDTPHTCYPKCISCCLVSVYKSVMTSKTLDVYNLRVRLSTVFKNKSLFQQNHKSDAIECLNAILNALHCKQIGDTSEGINESALNENCRSSCISHNLFSLGVIESYQCECESQSQTEWDYSNYCQYFNIADILSQADLKKSKNLLIVPIIKLKNYKNDANCDLKGKMMTSLQLKLQTAEVDCCSRDNCKKKKSKISFSLPKPPSIYLLNIIWESDEVSHLDSFIATISITESITMKEIYGNSTSDIYNLRGILFYKKSHYEYALRTDNFWAFKGLGEECGWYELLKETTIMNYHPICLVYERSLESYILKISHSDLLELEKLACECYFYENKINEDFYNDFLDDCTGLFNTRKKKSSSNNPITESPKITQEDNYESQHQQKNLEIIDKRIKEVRISEEKKSNPKPSDNLETKKPLSKSETKQSNCNNIEKSSNNDPVFDEKKNVNQKSWKCSCGSENLNDWDICPSCQGLKPGIQGWVCKFCTNINNDSEVRCEACFSYKNQNSQSEFWKCSKCDSFNTGSKFSCSKCKSMKSQVSSKPANVAYSGVRYPKNNIRKS